jgi:glycyl-tRNA synthetase beta chain
MTDSLIIELLTEELPPKSLKALGDAFGAGLEVGLKTAQLLSDASVVEVFATPRRLAALITHVLDKAPAAMVREKVLPVSIAFDASGQPTVVLIKKLAALGLDVAAVGSLEKQPDGKGESLYYTREVTGQTLDSALSQVLERAIAGLPIAKMMSYQVNPGRTSERTVQFARPAHGLVAIHGSRLVPASALGLSSRNTTLGHRFMSSGPITILHANQYEELLLKQFVVASFEKRQARILEQLDASRGDAKVVAPSALLNEVTALVEWPVVYQGAFEHEFLQVPQECLVLTMQQNQKYFALTDDNDKMLERFLLVSNLATDHPQAIVKGNERVLRARLADAKFFFEQDRKRTLESRRDALKKVVYFKKLGSLFDRSQRIEALARQIAREIGANETLVARAAILAKADLTTDMVGEFPELQGIMGRYYALADGEPLEVANAVSEHYLPRFANDELPHSPTGICVALADKLESLASLFALGETPSGERDPHALRRQALGVLRILMDRRLGLTLDGLLRQSSALFADQLDPQMRIALPNTLGDFVYERLRGLLRERGYEASAIEAVLSLSPQRIDQVPLLLDAVSAFGALPEAPSLAAANKRIGNILKKNPPRHAALDAAKYVEPAEHALGEALVRIAPAVDAEFARGDYTGMLKQLATLKLPVDKFFADVMVMSDDESLRNNRLALLSELHSLMNRVADLSMLAA